MATITINVEGMSCNHCKMTVESNLSRLEGIESVKADPDRGNVIIGGETIDLEAVRNMVNSLGYRFTGSRD